MLGRLEQPGPVEASHGQPYGAGAPALGEERRSAFCTEAATYATVGTHPSYGAVDGEPSQGHHDTRVEGGTVAFWQRWQWQTRTLSGSAFVP